MFIYPNVVISLMWGWQFILAALLGIAAILLPEYRIPFTTARYLLLIPAFIFTSSQQFPELGSLGTSGSIYGIFYENNRPETLSIHWWIQTSGNCCQCSSFSASTTRQSPTNPKSPRHGHARWCCA